MNDSSRRGFLILAGAGAAAVAVAPAALAGTTPPEATPATVDGPLVAYISDVSSGTLSVMVGEHEVVVHDRALCASLARAVS